MSLSDTLDVVRQDGPAWLDQRRLEAAQRLHRSGLPGRKVESWRFTPVAAIAQADFAEPDAGADVRLRARAEAELPDDGCARLWLINGVPQAAAGLPAGVTVADLADCADDPDVRDHLGAHARADYFAALNATSFARGLVVKIAPGARPERPLHVIHVADGEGRSVVVTPRLLVLAGAGSEATLVETYLSRGSGKLLCNPVTEVVLADAAQLEHVRVADAPAVEPTSGIGTWYHTASLATHVARNASYRSRVITLGGALTRLELDVVLDGEGAECALLGAYHAGGREHVDHQTRIDHARPRASSIENYRGIVDGRGLAVFDGQIFVRKDAQHTVAHQENRNLILGDGAGVHTKPHLEIDADDVVCSHGATVGALDDGQLFYLRARGIGAEQAAAMLTFAFVREITDAIGHAPVREWLSHALRARLPHGEMVES